MLFFSSRTIVVTDRHPFDLDWPQLKSQRPWLKSSRMYISIVLPLVVAAAFVQKLKSATFNGCCKEAFDAT